MRGLFLKLLLLLVLPVSTFANGLVLTNLVVNQSSSVGGTVSFNIQWQNSWRVSTVPNNWDAAWVFVKFRECGVAPTVDWTHGLINTSMSSHTFPAELEPVLADGSAVGIEAAPNNTGVMLRRTATNNVFPNAPAVNVTLGITNLPANTTTIDLKVFGIEMVFIPAGEFTVGDNSFSTAANAWNVFQQTLITSATTALNMHHLWWCSNPQALSATFPRGINAFHIMKYEITQGQYAEFLNTLPSTAQVNRFMGNNPNGPCGGCAGDNRCRYTLSDGGTPPNLYVAGRQNRAMNFLTWRHISAYLDWAALRPMSELEYTKACRGPAAVVNNEYPWGNTTIVDVLSISTTVPSEDGTEISLTTNANCNYNSGTVSGGDGGHGPVRSGLFALATSSTRTEAGATYYGVLDMGGNVMELVIPLSNNTNPVFRATWGNGMLDANGDHNVPDWPDAVPSAGGHCNQWAGWRGGGWENGWGEIRTESRCYCAANNGCGSGAVNGIDTYSCNRNGGGRGVR